MKNISLKKKLIFGAIGMVVFIMVISSIFVSIYVSKQNRDNAKDQIKNAMNVVRLELMDKDKKLLADTIQMTTANKLPAELAFLTKNKTKSIFLFIKKYDALATSIHVVGKTSNLKKMMIYDSDGDLRVFALRNKDVDTLGYVHFAKKKTTFYMASIKEGEGLNRQ